MRFFVLLIFVLIVPTLCLAAPCSNPRTCEGPAWLKNPPQGTIVAKSSTRIGALSKALLATAEYLQAQVSKNTAGYTSGQNASALTNQEICGVKIKGMTKSFCADKDCKTTTEKTVVARVMSGDGIELKLMESLKKTGQQSDSEINVSMTAKKSDLVQLLTEARKKCVINEVFFQDMIWVAIKLGK